MATTYWVQQLADGRFGVFAGRASGQFGVVLVGTYADRAAAAGERDRLELAAAN
jgi:hypothetical protein